MKIRIQQSIFDTDDVLSVQAWTRDGSGIAKDIPTLTIKFKVHQMISISFENVAKRNKALKALNDCLKVIKIG